MQTVTECYLLGIREGRDYLKQFAPSIEEMRALAANCETLLKQGFAREMADVFRGERDFWRNQINKGSK